MPAIADRGRRRGRPARAVSALGGALLAGGLAVSTGVVPSPVAAEPPPAASAQSPGTADDGAGGARVVEERRTGERTVDLRVESPAVGGTVPVRLLLPSGWEERPERTWPVLYLLQGAHDDQTSWTRETEIEEFTADKDVLTVMPYSGPTGIPTRWWNGGERSPDYETFQVEELGAILRQTYRASEARAVAGVSTGAYGALAFAARHPGEFAAAAAFSGIPHTRLPGVPTLLNAIVAREGLGPLTLWGSRVFQREVWEAHDPYARAERLRGTELYLSSGSGVVGGDGDLQPEALESAVWPSNRSFAERLRRLDIPATVHLYSGGSHAWPYWEREFRASWPQLAKGLGLPEAQRDP